jgi:hypothetical protein
MIMNNELIGSLFSAFIAVLIMVSFVYLDVIRTKFHDLVVWWEK